MLASPLKTKLVCPPELPVEVVVLLLLLPLGFARKSIQGTATCLPPALEVLEVEEELEVLPEGDELLDAPEELSDRTAKSIRPELGLIITSLMVPNSPLELLVTWAPVS